MSPYFQYVKFSSLYNNEKYEEIFSVYENKNHLSSEILHNLGNSYFMQYIKTGEEKNLYSAFQSYSGSLALEEHQDTRYNYEYIKSLLPESEDIDSSEKEKDENTENKETQNSEKPQDEASSESQQESGNQQSEGEKSQGKNSENNEEQISENNQQNNPGENTGETQQEQGSELTESQRQQLEDTVENLKNQQIYNQRYFGKQQQEADFFQDFGNFGSFLGEINRGGEKDW